MGNNMGTARILYLSLGPIKVPAKIRWINAGRRHH